MDTKCKDRSKIKCPHSEFSVELVRNHPFIYLKELVDEEYFPHFQPGICSHLCKEKMQEIVEITFTKYKNLTKSYFEDVKMVLNSGPYSGCDLWEYCTCLVENNLVDDSTLYFDLGVVNGNVVRLCNNTNEFLKKEEPKK